VDVGRAGPSPGVWSHTLKVGLEDYANNVFERLAWRTLPPHCGRISRPGQPGPSDAPLLREGEPAGAARLLRSSP
jgi:hypothetical protein